MTFDERVVLHRVGMGYAVPSTQKKDVTPQPLIDYKVHHFDDPGERAFNR